MKHRDYESDAAWPTLPSRRKYASIPGMRDEAPELNGPVRHLKRCVDCGATHEFAGPKCARCQEWV